MFISLTFCCYKSDIFSNRKHNDSLLSSILMQVLTLNLPFSVPSKPSLRVTPSRWMCEFGPGWQIHGNPTQQFRQMQILGWTHFRALLFRPPFDSTLGSENLTVLFNNHYQKRHTNKCPHEEICTNTLNNRLSQQAKHESFVPWVRLGPEKIINF